MTEQELDRVMRRVLIDSLKGEEEETREDPAPSFAPSPRHRRRMRAMLADPLNWLRRRERPLWRQIAQRAAVIALACTVAFGGVMALSPTARAAVVRWAVEWYENGIVYQYAGEQNPEPLPQYEITELPEGFVETVRETVPGLVSVTYQNQEGNVIYFDYSFIQQGAHTKVILNDDRVFDVMVNQMNGQFIESQIPGNLNSLIWIDPDLNLHFSLDGCFGLEEFLHMAESISLYKMPN